MSGEQPLQSQLVNERVESLGFTRILGSDRSISHVSFVYKRPSALNGTELNVANVAQSIGPSMLPTLNVSHDIALVERISVRRGNIKLGDVIVATSPTNPKKQVCKRILGMPGDYILIDPTVENKRYISVPSGHVWLQGDNYTDSTDSRSYGPVPIAMITGKVVCRFWPKFSWIGNELKREAQM